MSQDNQFQEGSCTNHTDFTSLPDIQGYSITQDACNQIRLSIYMGKAYVKHQV